MEFQGMRDCTATGKSRRQLSSFGTPGPHVLIRHGILKLKDRRAVFHMWPRRVTDRMMMNHGSLPDLYVCPAACPRGQPRTGRPMSHLAPTCSIASATPRGPKRLSRRTSQSSTSVPRHPGSNGTHRTQSLREVSSPTVGNLIGSNAVGTAHVSRSACRG